MTTLSKPFAEIVTFSRPVAANRINEQGQVEAVAANIPRYDFDPATLDCRGLLLSAADGDAATLNLDQISATAYGSWLIDGEIIASSIASGPAITGNGTFVFVQDGDNQKIYTEAGQLVSRQRAAPTGTVNLYSLGIARLRAVKYFPSVLSAADARALCTGTFDTLKALIDGIPLMIGGMPIDFS